jgi:hypothetical protein
MSKHLMHVWMISVGLLATACAAEEVEVNAETPYYGCWQESAWSYMVGGGVWSNTVSTTGNIGGRNARVRTRPEHQYSLRVESYVTKGPTTASDWMFYATCSNGATSLSGWFGSAGVEYPATGCSYNSTAMVKVRGANC